MINHINLKAFRGSITDFTKINYIDQEAAKGLCVYLTKFWYITSTKNLFVVVLTIQNHDKETAPATANQHIEIDRPAGETYISNKTKNTVSYVKMGDEVLDGFEDRDGFKYSAYSVSIGTPSGFSDYRITFTIELDGKTYALTETGNIYDEYRALPNATQPTLTMLKSVSKAKVADIEEVD